MRTLVSAAAAEALAGNEYGERHERKPDSYNHWIRQVGQWQNPLACWLRDRALKALPASAQFKPLEDVAGYEVAPML